MSLFLAQLRVARHRISRGRRMELALESRELSCSCCLLQELMLGNILAILLSGTILINLHGCH